MTRFFTLAMIALWMLGLSAPLQAQPSSKHYFVFQADVEEMERRTDGEFELEEAMIASLEIAERRLDGMGGLAYQLDYRGEGRIGLTLIHEDAPEIARTVFGIVREIRFVLVDEDALPEQTQYQIARPGSEVLPFAQALEDGTIEWLAVRIEGGISAHRLIAAQVTIDPASNESALALAFDKEGAAQLAALTRANVGKRMAIVMEEEILSAPFIQEPISGGQLQISAGFTHAEANELAIQIKSGELPTPFKIVEHHIAELSQ